MIYHKKKKKPNSACIASPSSGRSFDAIRIGLPRWGCKLLSITAQSQGSTWLGWATRWSKKSKPKPAEAWVKPGSQFEIGCVRGRLLSCLPGSNQSLITSPRSCFQTRKTVVERIIVFCSILHLKGHEICMAHDLALGQNRTASAAAICSACALAISWLLLHRSRNGPYATPTSTRLAFNS